ncbi:hypothetical protein SmJEL517_g01233 [Synchytrium microbalum]|uniref:R3H domain-containing protein n=1 Tax=Synchytrium microbalum TaxID=1806994 RepID=A0A507CAC2_9FUNG|nr:uncharacterized protein SmJEL517_g01233 [Synchytrium microbalum]TPX36552.1 hypothetical protein SmJEL517_g01233 [Synchytrium microbalum]
MESSSQPESEFDELYGNWEGWKLHSGQIKLWFKTIFEMAESSKEFRRTDATLRSQLHALSRLFGLHSKSTGTGHDRFITITKPPNWTPPATLPYTVPLDIDLNDTKAIPANDQAFQTYYASWNGWAARKPEIKHIFRHFFASNEDSVMVSDLTPAQLHEIRHTTIPLGLTDRHGSRTCDVIISKVNNFCYKVPEFATPFPSLSSLRRKSQHPERAGQRELLDGILPDLKWIICTDCWDADPYLKGYKRETYDKLYMDGFFDDPDWFD